MAVRRMPQATGESTKMQPKYRGPLVVTEVLPSDTYRIASIPGARGRRYESTATVSQLKIYKAQEDKIDDEEEPQSDVEEYEEPQSIEELTTQSSFILPADQAAKRPRRPPANLKDYYLQEPRNVFCRNEGVRKVRMPEC